VTDSGVLLNQPKLCNCEGYGKWSTENTTEMLKVGCRILPDNWVAGLMANAARCRANVMRSPGLATVLNPLIGYERAARIAKESLKTGKSVYDLALEARVVTRAQLDALMDPSRITGSPVARRLRKTTQKRR